MKKTTKAQDVLPESLLREIQKYVQGRALYIPKEKSNRAAWGQSTGSREALRARNAQIRSEFAAGERIEALAQRHHLSCESIRKIVYRRL